MISIHKELRPADEAYGYPFGCDGLCTIKEAMAFLGVGRSTIERRAKDGRLRRGKIGPIVRICKRSLMEYANSIED